MKPDKALVIASKVEPFALRSITLRSPNGRRAAKDPFRAYQGNYLEADGYSQFTAGDPEMAVLQDARSV